MDFLSAKEEKMIKVVFKYIEHKNPEPGTGPPEIVWVTQWWTKEGEFIGEQKRGEKPG